MDETQAKNLSDLAKRLSVTRQTIYDYKKKAGAPTGLDISEWVDFMNSVRRKADAPEAVNQGVKEPVSADNFTPEAPANPQPSGESVEHPLPSPIPGVEMIPAEVCKYWVGKAQGLKLVAETRKAQLGCEELELKIAELRRQSIFRKDLAPQLVAVATVFKQQLNRMETEFPGKLDGKPAREISEECKRFKASVFKELTAAFGQLAGENIEPEATGE